MKLGKKIATGLFLTTMTAMLFCGCGTSGQADTDSEKDKIKIVCASFPEYDWTRQIVGEENENIELTLIVNNGMDIHNYQPSVEDMVKIGDCDLIIYNGGTSEEWIEDAVEDSQKKPQMISVMEFLEDDVVEEEVVEGMEEEEHAHETEADHEEEHAHETEADHEEEHAHETEAGQEEVDHEEDHEYDEHVWLSLKNAEKIVNKIAEAVVKIDSEQRALYETNKNAYLEKLESLDASYEVAVQEAKGKILLFGDRFPFRYLTEDYGLTYYAAFPGCSAETEASFETIVFLADKIEECKLPCILTIDGSDKTIAESIQKNVDGDVAIKELNSLQSVSEAQITEGITYLSVMEQNLEVIKEALQ